MDGVGVDVWLGAGDGRRGAPVDVEGGPGRGDGAAGQGGDAGVGGRDGDVEDGVGGWVVDYACCEGLGWRGGCEAVSHL